MDSSSASTPDAEIYVDDVISASFPRDDRRLIRVNSLRARIEAAARSRAPHCVLVAR